MKVLYILFFGILNLLFFSQLTKKIVLNLTLKIIMLSFVLLFFIYHFWNPLGKVITDKLFFILIAFSFSLLVFYIMPKIAVWFTTYINDNEKDELLYKWYSVITDYVIYILISVFQFVTIIKNK